MLCGSHIRIWNLANHMKNKTKSTKMLGLLMKNWKLRVWCSLFLFFMWFARFQILIFEPQSIRHKLLVLSWLYKEIWSYLKISMNDYQENPWLWADLFIRKSGVSEVNVCLEKSELKLEEKKISRWIIYPVKRMCWVLYAAFSSRNLWGENLPGWFHTWK